VAADHTSRQRARISPVRMNSSRRMDSSEGGVLPATVAIGARAA
jgi:hypothetical protein